MSHIVRFPLPIYREPAVPVRRGPAHVLGMSGAPTGSSSPVGSTFWRRVRRCPREHALHQIARLRGEYDDEALTIGWLFHHGLEVYYGVLHNQQTTAMRHGYVPRAQDDAFWMAPKLDAERAAWMALAPVAREPGYEQTFAVLENTLAHYFNRYRDSDKLLVLAVEPTLRYSDPARGFDYSARLDTIAVDYAEASPGLWLVEHKTARSITANLLEGYQLDLQTLGQAWLWHHCIDTSRFAQWPFRGVKVNIASKAKTPLFERVNVCPSSAHLAAFEASIERWVQIEQVYAALGYPHAFGACTGPDRGFRRCGFFDLCHTHPLAELGVFERMDPPPDGYVRVDPEDVREEKDYTA